MTIKSAYLSYCLECDICHQKRSTSDVIGIITVTKDNICKYTKTTCIKDADWHICNICLKQIGKLDKNKNNEKI